MDLLSNTLPVDAFKRRVARKEKLLADLQVFKDERGRIAGWEAPAFGCGYTLPDGVALGDEDDARAWFLERVEDGSFDFLLDDPDAPATPKPRKPTQKRRLVDSSKYRDERDLERAIQAKKEEIAELTTRQADALARGGPDQLAGVIGKARAYLDELQVLRAATHRGKF